MKIIDCLPQSIIKVITDNIENVREIRLRADKPVYVNLGGVWKYACLEVLSNSSAGAIVTSQNDIEDTINRICDNSIFAYEHQLISGYLTAGDGVRVGVGGRLVMEGNSVKCYSEYNSLCVRIAHHISNCSNVISVDKLSNVIVISPPGGGKTTFLRDILVRLSRKYNCVCLDDRSELTECDRLMLTHCDTLLQCNKATAVDLALRCLSPQCIVTDELISGQYSAIKRAMDGGICVYTSIHGCDESVIHLLASNGLIFDKYVFLGKIGENNHVVIEKSSLGKLL